MFLCSNKRPLSSAFAKISIATASVSGKIAPLNRQLAMLSTLMECNDENVDRFILE